GFLLVPEDGEFYGFCILAVAAFFAADRVLIAMKVIGVIPIRFTVLRAQAIGIHRRVHSPGMNFFERVILVDEKDAIPVFLEKPGEKRLVHARTERTLE